MALKKCFDSLSALGTKPDGFGSGLVLLVLGLPQSSASSERGDSCHTLETLTDPWLHVSQGSEGMPGNTCYDRIILEVPTQAQEMNNCPGH